MPARCKGEKSDVSRNGWFKQTSLIGYLCDRFRSPVRYLSKEAYRKPDCQCPLFPDGLKNASNDRANIDHPDSHDYDKLIEVMGEHAALFGLCDVCPQELAYKGGDALHDGMCHDLWRGRPLPTSRPLIIFWESVNALAAPKIAELFNHALLSDIDHDECLVCRMHRKSGDRRNKRLRA